MTDRPHFRPLAIFDVLSDRAVEYIVVGGIAGVLHGAALRTGDLDICPRRSPENLARLADALRDLGARLRVDREQDGVPFDPSPALLEQMRAVTMSTRFGDLDLRFAPAAFDGYDDLAPRAIEAPFGNTTVPIAALDDVIRSKETADRSKDRRTLPMLYALRDEIAIRGRDR